MEAASQAQYMRGRREVENMAAQFKAEERQDGNREMVYLYQETVFKLNFSSRNWRKHRIYVSCVPPLS